MSEFDHSVPVTRWNAAFGPALHRLTRQPEGTGEERSASDLSDNSGVEITHPDHAGGTTPPRQGEKRPSRARAGKPHKSRVSSKSRPEAYSIIAKDVGKRIRWARELVEPNRAAFARLMDVDRSTVRDMESGRRPPSIFAVLELSHRLRVTPNYLLLGNLRDVDGELAARLVRLHPELLAPENNSGSYRKATALNTPQPPTTPTPRKKRKASA